MKVRKSDTVADPSYPDAKDFVKNRGVLGAAMVGAGMMLGGCTEPRRTTGVPMRTGGVVVAPSEEATRKPVEKSAAKQIEKPTAMQVEKPAPRDPKTSEKNTEGPPRLLGKMRAEPEPPARLLGDVMVAPRFDPQNPDRPPVLGGVPPVVPPNLEH